MNEEAALPHVNAREVINALQSAGFSIVRTTGSHVHLKKPGHRFLVTVPSHGSKTIKPGTLRNIIRASGMTKVQFIEHLERFN